MQQLHPKTVWKFFLGKIPIFIVTFVFIIGGLIFAFSDQGPVDSLTIKFITYITLIFIIVLLILYFISRLQYKYYKFELTDIAVKIEKGIISKRYTSIPFAKIQNVDIYRDLLDRILGLSSVLIQTAGYGALESVGSDTEGILPGLDKNTAEKMRDELINKSQLKK